MRYAYYPGCAAKNSTLEVDAATKGVARILGIELEELEGASCCGSKESGGLEIENRDLGLALNARTLAMAEAKGLDILNVCNTCQLKLGGDNKKLKEDPQLRERINKILAGIGLEYRGGVEVKHLLWVLLEDVGLQKMRDSVRRPLKGLKIAPFYGCHLIRPGRQHGFSDDPYRPSSLDLLIELVGAEAVDYDGKSKCCGFHSLLISEKAALRMTGKHLREAKGKEADCVVTPCPLCHTVLDAYQREAEKELNVARLGLPVLHLPQMMGLAFGIDSKEMMMSRHSVVVGSLIGV